METTLEFANYARIAKTLAEYCTLMHQFVAQGAQRAIVVLGDKYSNMPICRPMGDRPVGGKYSDVLICRPVGDRRLGGK